MPVYQYEDARTGGVVELVRPVDRRDKVPVHLKRVTVPRRIEVLGVRLDPGTAAASVPIAFRRLEETVPYREIERQSGFKAEEIKRVWDL